MAATLGARPPFDLPPPLVAIVGIIAGWITMLVFAPWRETTTLVGQDEAIDRLSADLRTITEGHRERRLQDLLVDSDGALGPLTEAIHDALAESMASRRQTRMLKRTMDDAIRRETDRATVRLKREATTDPLTGLGNRRTMQEKLDELFGPDRRRNRESVVVMLIDVDLFKSVNDRLGHEVGDECLVFLGNLLNSTLRREDCAVRLGGDEFAVFMPNLTTDEAVAVAERVRALFRQMPWRHKKVRRPSLSIGIATTGSRDPEGREKALARADEALYRSKAAGRDTIRVAPRGLAA